MTPQTLWPPRSIGLRARLTHDCPHPPGKSRAAPGFAPALRAIRRPDAFERLTPLIVLFGMSGVFGSGAVCAGFLSGMESLPGGRGRHGAGVLLYHILIPVVLLLRIWRPIGKIPAVAENGNIDAPGASRRSLSGTHFAREGSAARVEMAGVAAPPGRTARRLAGSLRLPCAVGAESL